MRGLRLSVVAAAAAALSCTAYDFEPVEPNAWAHDHIHYDVIAKLPPNVALVVDKSGSMDQPMDGSLAACGGCGTSKANLCNTATCPTRWSELQRATNEVLPQVGEIVRLGLVTFPADAVCGAPGSVRAPVPNSDDSATLSANALAVNAIIQQITSNGTAGTPNTTGGGTPTAMALNVLEREPLMTANETQRKSVAILLTDGLPNCNGNNPNDWRTNPTACQCTLADCSTYPKQGCLDEDATVAEIRALRQKGILTAVIGFGAEAATGPAPAVLRAMAEAGGFNRSCTTAADCAAGDACNGGVCSTGLYLPTNGAQLASALRQIAQRPNPCIVELAGPVNDVRGVQVKVGGEYAPSTDYSLVGSQLTLTGATCDMLLNATPSQPVVLDVVAVDSL